ncbi:hypothetical protein RCS94_00385 [Orbaceae bacterium ac157xtp]
MIGIFELDRKENGKCDLNDRNFWEKDRKWIGFDRKDQNDRKRIHARGAVLTAPRRQGRRTEFGTFVFVLCATGLGFHFWLFVWF